MGGSGHDGQLAPICLRAAVMRRLRWDRGPSPECDRHEPQYYICSAHERQDDSFDAIDDARQDKPEVDELCEWQVGRQRLVHFRHDARQNDCSFERRISGIQVIGICIIRAH